MFQAEKLKEALDLLLSLDRNGMLYAAWETLYVTVIATAFAVLIGLPLGVLLVVGEKNGVLPLPKWLIAALGFIINTLRSVPFLILMVFVIPFTRMIVGTSVGTVASIVPLVIAAFPFVARLTENCMREVSPNIIEAAESLGASPLQIIFKVMIPESVPLLISNFTTAVTTILGYSAMSGALGGGGLGKVAMNYGYYRYQTAILLFAVVLIVILVQVIQSVGTKCAIRSDKRLKNK